MSIIQKVLTQNPKELPKEESLGFGKYFTDHMFIAHFAEGKGWYDSKIVPYGAIPLEPGASVLQYGQSIFEGMKAFKQESGEVVLFRPDFNYQRLINGAESICLHAPSKEIFMLGISELVKTDVKWIPKGQDSSLYIRPTLIGSESFLGVRPSKQSIFYIILSPVGNYYAEGNKPISIWIEDKHVRAVPGGLGSIKAGANYAASLKAAVTAKEKGYAQVLWLDYEHKGIEEVGTMNVFFVFKDEIVTPMLNGSILAGATRDSVIQILKNQKKNIVERKITITEVIDKLKQGQLIEAFGTGTAAIISAIGKFYYQGKDWSINNNQMGELSLSLRKQILDIQKGRTKDTFGWIHHLK